MSYVAMVATVSGFLFSLIGSKLINALGPKKSLLVGSLASAVFLCLIGSVDNLVALGLVSLAQGAVLGLGAHASCAGVIAGWYGDRMASVIGVVFGFSSFGSTVFSLLAGQLLKVMSYHTILVSFGIGAAVIGVLANLLLIRMPAAQRPAAESGAAAAPDGKKTDLLLWLPPFAAGDDGALDKEFWTETLAPWAAENNVDLTIEITPWGNYEEKYLTGFSSGEGPDVGYMYLEMFNDFIEMGALEPLDAYITDADRENYLYLDKGFIKGKQYTMPFIVGNARILYFNMDILEQAGGAARHLAGPGGRCRKDKRGGPARRDAVCGRMGRPGHRRAEQPVLSVPVAGGRRHLQRGRHQGRPDGQRRRGEGRPVPVRPQVQIRRAAGGIHGAGGHRGAQPVH